MKKIITTIVAIGSLATFAWEANLPLVSEVSATYGVTDVQTNGVSCVSGGVARIAFPAASSPRSTAALTYTADGTAVVVNVASNSVLTADTTNWTVGQTQTAIITIAAGAAVSPSVVLVGYSQWPTGQQFIAACIFVGGKVYVNPVSAIQ